MASTDYSDYHCPYCDMPLNDESWFEEYEGEGNYERQCPSCKGKFSVYIYVKPFFEISDCVDY